MYSERSPRPQWTPLLTDLPTELILRIFDHLPPWTARESLCALGSTCRRLNTIALPYFFNLDNTFEAGKPDILAGRQAPGRHTLRAIRSSLDTGNIKKIEYFFSGVPEVLLDELLDMRSIVNRADEITHFKVHLSNSDALAESISSCYRLAPLFRLSYRLSPIPEKPRVSIEKLKAVLVDLLTVVAKKGCSDMTICGGSQFFEFLEKAPGMSALHAGYKRVARKWICASKKRTKYFDDNDHPFLARPSSTITSSSVATHCQASVAGKQGSLRPTDSRLRTLTFHSDLMLSDLFIDWTSQFLSWSSQTTTQLAFHCPNTPSRTWRLLLSEATFPSLRQFHLSCDTLGTSQAHLQSTDLCGFLSRHPNIQILHLGGVQPPTKAPALHKPDAKPFSPKSQRLRTHPIYSPRL